MLLCKVNDAQTHVFLVTLCVYIECELCVLVIVGSVIMACNGWMRQSQLLASLAQSSRCFQCASWFGTT